MGAGKSTVGRRLASLLSAELVDSDAEIERRTGRRIPEIFVDGESAFRKIEEDVVAQLLSQSGCVLSLGGGAVLSAATRARLAGHPVVYLTVTPERGFARVAGSDRPLLRADDPAARYAELLASRDATYRGVATLVVDTENHSPAELAARVAELLENPSR
nr:shikimate kinase [Jongsikchunia kroppenstedtii]